MSSKNRLEYVDVVTHILASMVIAFFFLSGYFHKPGKRNLGDNIKTRAKSLLISFFRYSLFFCSKNFKNFINTYIASNKPPPLDGCTCT